MNSSFESGSWIMPLVILVLITIAILDVYLRGKSLWRAARNSQTGWFIALLIINSMGVLPVIYLLTNKENSSKKKSK